MNSTANNSVSLGNVKYGRILKMFGGNVDIWGTVQLANTTNLTLLNHSYFVIDSNTISIRPNATVSAAYIVLQADGQVTLDSGSKIISYT